MFYIRRGGLEKPNKVCKPFLKSSLVTLRNMVVIDVFGAGIVLGASSLIMNWKIDVMSRNR